MREATNYDSNYELIIKIVFYLLAIPLCFWVEWGWYDDTTTKLPAELQLLQQRRPYSLPQQ